MSLRFRVALPITQQSRNFDYKDQRFYDLQALINTAVFGLLHIQAKL